MMSNGASASRAAQKMVMAGVVHERKVRCMGGVAT